MSFRTLRLFTIAAIRLILVILAFCFYSQPNFAQSATVQITSPLPETVFLPGDVISVTVVISDPTPFNSVVLVGKDLGIFTISNKPPFKFSVRVPSGIIGEKNLTAIGVINRDKGIFSLPVSVTIGAPSAPLDLTASTSRVGFSFVGQEFPINIYGKFSNGSNTSVIGSPQLTLSSQNAKIVDVAENGVAIATGAGATNIVASYGAAVVTIPVSVPAATRGDLNGDGLVDLDDLAVLKMKLNSSATTSNDARDLNRDSKIDALDARILATLCTYPRCASQPPQ